MANGTTLDPDFDAFKAAAYWYDTRHDGSDGSGMADIDLRLRNAATGTVLRSDLDRFDNKARIY